MHRRNRTLPIVLVGAMAIGAFVWCADFASGQMAPRLAGTPSVGASTGTTASPDGQAAANQPAPGLEPAAEEEPIVVAQAEETGATIPVNPQVDAASGIITHLPLQDAPIREVLRQLSNVGQKNIIPGKNVTGKVTADLFNVTWREALDAILRVSDLGYVEEGNFIYVHTLKEMDSIQQARRKMVTKVFTMYYAKPQDVEKLIKAALSKDGSVTVTPSSQAGVDADEADAGGMDYALNDVLVVTDYEDRIKAIEEVIASVDQRPVQVLIEATILRVQLTEDNALGIDWTKIAGVDFCRVGFTTDTGAANIGAGTPPDGLTVNADFSSDVSVFVRALENTFDTNVVANPKLLVVNKQRGQILVGQRQGYFDATTTTDTGGTTTSVDFLETGTNLIVRPFVGREDYIRLEVFPKDSDGQVDEVSGLPTESTTQCTTNVIVKDGHTIVISGLFRESTSVGRTQVPVLGNIPVVGALFRTKADEVQREEVIILLTPRVVKMPADEIVSEQLKDDMARFQLGMRESLNWWGRDRLAACHMGWAKRHAAAGRETLALWEVNLAIGLSPLMHEALMLREQLTGQAIWAGEPRYSSAQWIVQKMWMNELGLDVNMVLPPDKPLDPTVLPESVRESLGIGSVPGITPAPVIIEPVSESDTVKTDTLAADVIMEDTACAVTEAATDEPVVLAEESPASQPAESQPAASDSATETIDTADAADETTDEEVAGSDDISALGITESLDTMEPVDDEAK